MVVTDRLHFLHSLHLRNTSLTLLTIRHIIPSLNILLRLDPNLNLLRPPIKTRPLEQIQVDRERHRNDKANKRNEERMLSVTPKGISHGSKNWWK